jgi:hypothetical protein
LRVSLESGFDPAAHDRENRAVPEVAQKLMGHPSNFTDIVDQISATPHFNKSTICLFD